ncbi:cobyrinic acid a,c-diamide synthase [Leptolyngbya valderiana BDU 20041]|uniref:ParA family protein n=1 Tax=Baaleninema simplex TaxID=2862350 RepID=UPI000348FB6D|nr:ParA family protein [Baaleninema simplex]MDC0833299.1 ParA family protein [Geitlerinema sp. CS-897]OAB62660.1 cobyrinic acid a,c-diamide synthase [Leptolyngbya valderiana BDU 20041]PPT08588.1 Chromosome (plasmid) partitioning protein ParA / Sporulation initiation inhibitor protein Soj [Geitlerinema sp. FC II]
MGYLVATTNMKGGVGKTTMTVNLAACLAKDHRKRVLVVDLDPQISATLSLMSPTDFAQIRKEHGTLKYLIQKSITGDLGATDAKNIVRPYAGNLSGIDILPGDIDLYNDFLVSEVLYKKAIRNPERNFEKVWNSFEDSLMYGILKPLVPHYDFIFLDCAPSYNLVTRSSLVCSDFYLIPAKPEPLSYIGMQLLERQVKKLIETHQIDKKRQTQLVGIVFTMSRNILAGRYYKQVMKRVRQEFNDSQVFKTSIPMDVSVSRAVDSFKPVVLTDPNSAGSKAFRELAREFLTKLQKLTPASQSVRLSKLE